MNILYLCNKKTYLRKMSRVRFHGIAALSKIANIHYSGIGWTDYNADLTVKENIHNISSASEKIEQLNGVLFDWKQDFIDSKGGEDGYFVRKTDVGVIAQDVEKVLPEIVATRHNGVKAVKYDRLVALLIEGFKEMKQEIKNLKKKTV